MGGRVKTASKFLVQVFVYKILSKSLMYPKSKQQRQYTWVLPVAPIVNTVRYHLTVSHIGDMDGIETLVWVHEHAT